RLVSVAGAGHPKVIRAQPAGLVLQKTAPANPETAKIEERRLRKRFQIGDRKLIVGVDRLDYTKGIPDRLQAIDRLLHRHPELKDTFVFVQVAAPRPKHPPTQLRTNPKTSTQDEHDNRP